MKSLPVKKHSKSIRRAGGLIINPVCFKNGKLYRVKMMPGTVPKILSEEEAVVTGKGWRAGMDIRIRCGCGGEGGCRVYIDGRWITCAPTVCEYCEMAISSRATY